MNFNALLVAFALLTFYFHFLTSRDTHFFLPLLVSVDRL